MRRFQMLTLGDLKQGLDDLLTTRQAALALTRVGKAYEDLLKQKRAQMDAVPNELGGGKPVPELLATTDAEHDGYGTAIYYLTEAYLHLPNIDTDVLEAIMHIRASLIPSLEQLRDSYADEAEAALRRKSALPALAADLMRVPVVGGSLQNWATAFVEAGARLQKLLEQPEDDGATQRKEAQRLRVETIGLLNHARTVILDEIASRPTLPRHLDTQIFGYLDDLEKFRSTNARPSAPGIEET
ncbi:MAG: hypothetical protein IPM54_04340 [Polyangiaceae bacterium]|nr:hypothetical protein [Polyangiaceae bacterium]